MFSAFPQNADFFRRKNPKHFCYFPFCTGVVPRTPPTKIPQCIPTRKLEGRIPSNLGIYKGNFYQLSVCRRKSRSCRRSNPDISLLMNFNQEHRRVMYWPKPRQESGILRAQRAGQRSADSLSHIFAEEMTNPYYLLASNNLPWCTATLCA